MKNKRPLLKRDIDPATRKPIPNSGGVTKATTDEETIRGWWRKWPNAMIAVSIVTLPHFTRLARASAMSELTREYVASSRLAGAGSLRLMFMTVLPNCLAPLIVQGTYICASAMLVEAILSFLGIGIPPETPSWGNIMAEGRALWQVKPYIVFFPAIFLSITVLAVNLLGDGLRDALDPRLAKRL